MRLGLVPYLDALGGGTYQHTLNVLEALSDRRSEMVVLYREPEGRALRRAGWDAHPLSPQRLARERLLRALGPARRLLAALRPRPAGAPTPVAPAAVSAAADARLARLGIGLLLFPTLDPFALQTRLPYVTTVHDLQFKLQPGVPDFADQVEALDFLVRSSVAEATLVLVDSEVGREDLLGLYGDVIQENRVRILPYLPAHYIARPTTAELAEVRRRYRLSASYLFYPAQFWPAKNHARLIEALARLRREGRDLHLALAGGHSGEIRERTFAAAIGLAGELGVDAAVHYLGYVPDRDMAPLYAGAAALVMPTFFGPTNIPVPEAWAVDCPVITSDIRGIREQVADAAVLVNPTDVAAIADGIRTVVTDPGLASRLAAAGRRRLASYTAADFSARLHAAIDEASALVRAGKAPRAG